MWYLVEEKDQSSSPKPSPRYWLGGLTGNGRTIGRKHVDIRLKASSVSRTHARITIVKSAFYSPSALSGRRRHHSTSVSVQDSSAYGTFLKYPPGHTSNRSEGAIGHHRRLDKDTPVDVCEGALLAFGAPSAWWRLAWHHIVLVPTRISNPERERIFSISGLTSVEVSESWGEDSTHLVTNECCTSSTKFLMALVEGKHVVTPAWVEAIRHTVTESCRAITEAANDDAAMNACALADEKHFIPPFSKADISAFSAEHLAVVFDDEVRERRNELLKGIVVAFGREERRSRWAAVIELLGGSAMLAKAIGSHDRIGRIVYVQGEYGSGRRVYEDVPGRAYIQESALADAIIRADLVPLDFTTEGKGNAAEVTDVATPGPLDSESEADTDDESEPAALEQKRAAEQKEATTAGGAMETTIVTVQKKSIQSVSKAGSLASGESDRAGQERVRTDSSQGGCAKKRTRVTPEMGVDATVSPGGKRTRKSELLQTPIVQSTKAVTDNKAELRVTVVNSDVNERVFFRVDGRLPKERVEDTSAEKDSGTSNRRTRATNGDVRRFRPRKLPVASMIPLKRVRCVSNVDGGLGRALSNAAEHNHGEDASTGAQVVESEEK